MGNQIVILISVLAISINCYSFVKTYNRMTSDDYYKNPQLYMKIAQPENGFFKDGHKYVEVVQPGVFKYKKIYNADGSVTVTNKLIPIDLSDFFNPNDAPVNGTVLTIDDAPKGYTDLPIK